MIENLQKTSENECAKLLLEEANCWNCGIPGTVVFELELIAIEKLDSIGCEGILGRNVTGNSILTAPSNGVCRNYKRDV